MSNLGNINFSDYDSDEFIGTNIYSCKNKLKPKSLKDKKKININDLDLENDSSSNVFCNVNKSISNNILSDCEIITYDNSIENKDNKSTEYNNYYENNNYSENNYSNNKNISKNISSLFYNNTNNYNNESSEDFTVYFDSSKLKQCPDNIPNEKKSPKKTQKIIEPIKSICPTDVITNKISIIIDSFKKISHLLQYYIVILDETKIQVSELEMSQAVKSCCETTTSVFTYLKAEIEKNKSFILDDKYHNREGYNLTNGITKIYYIEKIQMKLFENGEAILGIFEENGRILTYELGDNYYDANFEGDLFISLDLAKQKANHFNKFIESKFNKISSIFNLQLIYLDKYKS